MNLGICLDLANCKGGKCLKINFLMFGYHVKGKRGKKMLKIFIFKFQEKNVRRVWK